MSKNNLETVSQNNLERLPELHAKKAAHEANLRDIAGAFKDKVRELRERVDPDTGKSVSSMLEEERKVIVSLEKEIANAWQFPNQVNMEL